MTAIPVRHVDVFTDQIFSGNPLTVVPDAKSLTDSQMQAIAAEFGTPETSFIVPPKGEADYGLRIFSQVKEIPFAGHPVLGAAHVFVSENKEANSLSLLQNETSVGILPIHVTPGGSSPKLIMEQGKPKIIAKLTEQQIQTVADSLRLQRGMISKDSSPQIISTGLPQLFIQLRELDQLTNLTPDPSAIRNLESKFNLTGVGIFTLETSTPEASAHLRFFVPSIGINEDAAAGSAAGGLGAYLAIFDLLPRNKLKDFFIEQGFEIGRRSRLYVQVEGDADIPDNIRVGGYSVTVSSGEIHIP
jgi:trans-2,3-dihydro-3-hydroxyanthranilate isomerase